MREHFKNVQDLKDYLQKSFLKPLHKKIEEAFEEEVNHLENVLNNASEKDLSIEFCEEFPDQVYHLAPKTDFKYSKIVSSLSESLDEKTKILQIEDRFIVSTKDEYFIKLGKSFKASIRWLQWLGIKSQNVFNKLIKKEEKKFPVWTVEVPVRTFVGMMGLDFSAKVDERLNGLRKFKLELLRDFELWVHFNQEVFQNYLSEKDKDDSEGKDAEADKKQFQISYSVFIKGKIENLNQIEKEWKKLFKKSFEEFSEKLIVDLFKLGTFELSSSLYDQNNLEKKLNKLQKEIEKQNLKWKKIEEAKENKLSLIWNYLKLKEAVESKSDEFSNDIHHFLEQHIFSKLEVISKKLDKSIQSFDEDKDLTNSEVKKLSVESRKKLIEEVESIFLNPLQNIIQEAELGTFLNNFVENLQKLNENQPEKAVLIEELSFENNNPTFELEVLNWKEMVGSVISNGIGKKLHPKELEPENFLSEVIKSIQEVSQIIDTNLELVGEVKRQDEEESFAVASDGLKRAFAKIDAVIEIVKAKEKEVLSVLNDGKKSALLKMAGFIVEEDINSLKWASAESKVKERAVNWKVKITVFWASFSEKVELFSRFIWKKTKEYYALIFGFLGFIKKESVEDEKTDLATFLSKTDDKINELPFIYRRLFDFKKDIDPRFYVRRTEQFERVKRAYELWQNDFPSTVIVIGEKGSGKSTFKRIISEEIYTEHSHINIDFDDTLWTEKELVEKMAPSFGLENAECIDDIIAKIKNKKKKSVVFLENIQNCYLRSISGYDAIEKLQKLISETASEVLWSATCSRYAWNFMEKVFNISEFFTHIVQSDKLKQDQIKSVILRRHRASGYQLEFLPSESDMNSRSFKKLLDNEEAQQSYLEEEYFEKLTKMAEGNASVAMIFWIRSIQKFDDTNFYIEPFNFKAIDSLEDLGNVGLFVLTAFVMHDRLNPKELSLILNETVDSSALNCSRLVTRGILMRREDSFVINHLIYRPVLKVLKQRNFIH